METKINKRKLSRKTKIMISSLFLVIALLSLFFISVSFYGGKHSIGEVFSILFSKKLTSNTNSVSDQAIQRSIWIIMGMIVGGMGLAVTGAISQSLTKNPLADASTLGTINATIFLLIISFAIGWISFALQYIFAIIGGVVAALLLVLILTLSKGKFNKSKIILIGLALSIAFKTLAFFFWHSDRGVGSAYSSYIIGGAEKIYGGQTYMPYPWITLFISSILIVAGTIVAIINSKGMSVTELGDEKAKNLGISIIRVRTLNIISLVLLVPASVIIVGNLAFIGLIATHIVRIAFKTRDYKKIIPLTALVGIVIALLGLTLNILIPKMPSSIWTTIIGAPMLVYLGWRKL